jgi:lactate permease
MYQQVYDPVARSLALTAIFAAIPLTLMFVMLGMFKRSPQLSALVSLVACAAVATLVYPMPFGVALNAGLFGVAFAIMTIGWILINAMWIYSRDRVLRRAARELRADQRRFARPGDHRGFLLRRVDRGAGRLRRADRDLQRNARRDRL